MSNPVFYPSAPPQIVQYDPAGGKITVNIKMDTLLQCDYRFLYEDETGTNKPYIDATGNNYDGITDAYTLAKPTADERITWCALTVTALNPGNDDGYTVKITFKQDGKKLTGSPLSTGARKISADGSHFVMIARLVPQL